MNPAVEVELPCALEGLSLRRELVSGRWILEGWGSRVVAREWRWGERRRLLAACVIAGRLDAERFVHAMVTLLCEPAPAASLERLYAHVLLGLFEIDGQRSLPSLDAAEVALGRRFGWGPAALAGESAVDLDRLLRVSDDLGLEPVRAGQSAVGRSPGPAPGWKRIVIDDG